MANYLNMTLPDRFQKRFVREMYDGNTVQTFFCYKDVDMTFAKREGTVTRLTDTFALELLEKGLITQEQLAKYQALVCGEYFFKDCHMEQTPEDIYAFICKSRGAVFGQAALAQGRQQRHDAVAAFDPADGIDQRAKKEELLQKCTAVIFLLTQPELFSQLEADLAAARALGKDIYVCASPDGEGDLPDRQQLTRWLGNTEDVHWLTAENQGFAWHEKLQTAIDNHSACLLFYGEDGLLHCRGLTVDAVVTAKPAGYHAQALCDQLGAPRDNVIYVPRGLDITPWVPIISQTRLTYYHLAKLWARHGDSIYACTPAQLYKQYPEVFINIYDTQEKGQLPITASGDSFTAFDESKDRAVAQYVNRFSNISYTAAYFDENLQPQPICYDETNPQPGILAHSIRVKKAQGARVIQCEKGVTPRQLFAQGDFPGTGLVSNFLFFMTPKLGALYNDLRSDRPYEQTDASSGHLDYMLSFENGVRRETFPLFEKCCVAMTRAGEFLFFNYRLGGGSVRLADSVIRWETADVNAREPGQVCVYTPFCTADDEDGDRETYRKAVGRDRVNIVIFQERIVCIRKGDVLLPGAGVVISLEEAQGQKILDTLQPLEDGYYDVSKLPLSVELDGPAEVDKETWQQVQWAWGGGLSMILNGKGLCDDGNMEQWFRKEGWMTPLSRQTQESVYHKSVKHPRTAIGTTENGDLILMVLSGRTWRSTGANYEEIVGIARKLYPDIRTLMNMDGGGSAVLGLVENGSFLELSCPATSTGSCVGMVRPINTMLYIPAEEETQ